MKPPNLGTNPSEAAGHSTEAAERLEWHARRALAHDFITFCDGVEEGGRVAFARRGRVVARELLDALRMLEAEQSARVAIQARCERQEELLQRYRAEVMTANGEEYLAEIERLADDTITGQQAANR